MRKNKEAVRHLEEVLGRAQLVGGGFVSDLNSCLVPKWFLETNFGRSLPSPFQHWAVY